MRALLKSLVLITFVLVAAIVLAARWSLERAAQRAVAAAAAPFAGAAQWGRIRARAFPPAAIVEDVVVSSPPRGELLRAARCILPLRPGAWLGRRTTNGVPSCEGWAAVVTLPRAAGSNWSAWLGGSAPPLPAAWRATGGTIEVRVGEPRAMDVFVIEGATARRAAGKTHVEGRVGGRSPGTFRLEGSSGAGGFAGTLAIAKMDAPPWSAWLVDPARGRVMGGALSVDGTIGFSGSEGLRLDLRLQASDVLVEGTLPAHPIEAALARKDGAGRVKVMLRGRLDQGADWPARVRGSLSR